MASVFDSMTNLYSLSKTLRFELKPIGKTKDYIEQESFFVKDQKKADYYDDIKQLLDEFHREFIASSLANLRQLPIEAEPDFKKLRQDIATLFDDAKSLWEAWVVEKLMEKYPDQAEKVGQFQWFWWYFKTYTQNRANLYKSEWKAGQIATRLIDENLPRFLKNKSVFEQIENGLEDFVVIEKDEKQQESKKPMEEYATFFDTTTYHNYVTQDGIDSYNAIVGHFNHSINHYKQQHGDKKIPLMQILYKLPLAPRKQVDRLPQQIEHHEQLIETILSVKARVEWHILPFVKNKLIPALYGDHKFDFDGIYVSLQTLEHWWWIALTWWSSFRELTHEKNKSSDEPKVKKEHKDFPYISLWSIRTYLDAKQSNYIEVWSVFGEEKWARIDWKGYAVYFFELILKDIERLTALYEEASRSYEANATKNTQKWLMDAALALRRLLGGFVLIHKKVRLNPDIKESQFYDGEDGLDAIFFNDDYDPIHTSYDKVRNYLTRKPYTNDEKIKVNFDNPTLLDGWDQNKERDNFGIILRKDWLYYLALMKKWANSFFDEIKNPKLYQWVGYDKMVYKLLPWPNKMLPKVIFSQKNIDFFWPSQEIIRIRKSESFKQGDNFSLQDLHTRIDFLKHCLSTYEWRKWYSFSFRPTQQYEKINEFYHDVESQGYRISWQSIDQSLLTDAVEKWDIYLFHIYSKDFNPHATGKKNIHTAYFQAIFAWGEENLFKLNGEAEIFWRKGSIKQTVREISPKHRIDIVDKRRYTHDKLMLHLPITFNFCRNDFRVNDRVKLLLKSHPQEVTILGIDRGEKHLLYYSLIKQDGTILKTRSRNTIQNGIKNIPYHEKLGERERKRDEAQLNRDQQEQIKDLKRGYISQVIHEICRLIIEHNAIVVLEDLNLWFKRSRQWIEKNVYQQFELALAQKLNYLVQKNSHDMAAGGVYKWYQLTPPVTTFGDLSFQTWIVFYTPPGYTSTTCPCCGWRKHMTLKYVNEESAKKDLSKLSIYREKDSYIVHYTISQDMKKWKSDTTLLNTERSLTTHNQQRVQYDRKLKRDIPYDITQELHKLFWEWSFAYHSWLMWASAGQCKTLMWLLALLMKIRNAQTWTDIDVIQCPSCWFHSDQGLQWHDYNGDANGAYNIARKWALIIKKVIAGEKTTFVTQSECDNAWTKNHH